MVDIANSNIPEWWIYEGQVDNNEIIDRQSNRYREMLDNPDLCPRWRNFSTRNNSRKSPTEVIELPDTLLLNYDDRGDYFVPDNEMIEMVNAALYLRRPLLISGNPGVGKSTLIYSVARALRLGPVLRWGINSRSTRQEGLYQYDAIGRLQDWQLHKIAYDKKAQKDQSSSNIQHEKSVDSNKQSDESVDIGEYLSLGPVGTAMLPYRRPRALLIDEIDKGDLDLADDLLDLLEDGQYRIPELARLKKYHPEIKVRTADYDDHVVPIYQGEVQCRHFPFVIITKNEGKEFSRAFRRRCLHLEVKDPSTKDSLEYWGRIIEKQIPPIQQKDVKQVIEEFINLRKQGHQTTDQLMQAIFMLTRDFSVRNPRTRDALLKKLLTPLN